MSQLAEWQCHKVVKAGRLITLVHDADDGGFVLTVEDANGVPCKVTVPEDFFARGAPIVDDYIVVYEDGYKSWSPKKAFEEGYHRTGN